MQGFIAIVSSNGMLRIIFPESLNGVSCSLEKVVNGASNKINLQNMLNDVLILEGSYDAAASAITCTGGRQLITGISI
jgi:hypothetical protein